MKNKRYDCFLLWGHGLKYLKGVIDILESDDAFEVKIVKKKFVGNVSKFVKKVYSFDYAPWQHLKSKTKYLKKTRSEVCFIFVENLKPDVDLVDVGIFRHEECDNVKRVKTIIREKFNPRNNGVLSHNHVVHATDNPNQTNEMLNLAGYDTSILELHEREPRFPWFLANVMRYRIRDVEVEDLYCHNIVDMTPTVLTLSESVQYQALITDMDEYSDYIDVNIGNNLQSFYSTDKYERLKDKFSYLSAGYETDYIIVKQFENGTIILDGLHRASLCLFKKMKKVLVCELYEQS